MKLPIFSKFGFNKPTRSEKDAILNWYGIGSVTPQTLSVGDAVVLDASKGVNATLDIGDTQSADVDIDVSNAKSGQSGWVLITQGGNQPGLTADNLTEGPDAVDNITGFTAIADNAVARLNWYTPDGSTVYYSYAEA